MIKHDEIIKAGIEAVSKVDLDDVVSAFIGSLSTKNLPARSAFGSYVVLKNLQKHSFDESEHFAGGNCRHCGLKETSKYPINEDAVEKYPFQVQHTNLRYAVLDLSSFNSRKVDNPSKSDVDILRSILDAMRMLPKDAQLTELIKAIQGKIKSNKHQRMILLESFGYAGILSPEGQQTYREKFLGYDFTYTRQPPEFFKREWEYPVRFWTGADGVNEEYVNFYFGKYL